MEVVWPMVVDGSRSAGWTQLATMIGEEAVGSGMNDDDIGDDGGRPMVYEEGEFFFFQI